jgi:nicotinamidase-related amidase
MPKTRYLTPGSLQRWTGELMKALEGTKGRARLPVLDGSAGLLLLDAQRLFVDEASPAFLPSWPAVRSNFLALAGHAEAGRRLAVVTRHLHPDGDAGGSIMHFFGRLLVEGDELSRLHPDMKAFGGARVLEKRRHSAFSNGALDPLLRERGIRTLLIAGVQTHLCVLATAVEAGTRDFIPVVVADATAAGDEDRHRAALTALSGGLAGIMTTREVIEQWR